MKDKDKTEVEVVESRTESVPAPRTRTIADVLQAIAAADMSERRKRDLRWAVNTACQGFGLAPEDVAANPAELRERLAQFSPAMLGLKPSSYSNLLSLVRKSLRVTQIRCRKRTRHDPLPAKWETLYRPLPLKAKGAMSGLISFLAADGVDPDTVTDTDVARYVAVLDAESLNHKWRGKLQHAIKSWNRAVDGVPGWPQVRLNSPFPRRENHCLAWDDLPPKYRSKCTELVEFLRNAPVDDDRAPVRPLRPATLNVWEFTLRYYGSVVVKSGADAAALTCPADLLKPVNIDALLRHFDPEQPDRGLGSYRMLLDNLLKIGWYTGKLPVKTRHRLKALLARAGRRRHGMTERNRRMVMMLKDPKVAARLMTLPPEIFKALRRSDKLKLQDASLALAALVIEFLLMFGPRIGNIAMIRIDKHIVRVGGGKTQTVRIVFQGNEVKNGQPLDFELQPETVRLLDEYLLRYKPLLTKGPSPYLFPRHDGDGPRSSKTFWSLVKRVTMRFVGVPMNPHLFRHVGAALFLRARPGLYEVPRRVFGHQSLDTTTTYYAGAETEEALRLYDENVLRLRQEAPRTLARTRGRRRSPAARRVCRQFEKPGKGGSNDQR